MLIASVAVVCVVVLESVLTQRIGDAFGLARQTWFRIVSGAAVIVSVCLVYAGYVRVFERRRTVELSSKRAVLEFTVGSAIGFGLFAITIGCLWVGGFYQVEGVGYLPSAATMLGVGLVPAFMEEILMRGIVFRITEDSLGTWLAMVFSASLFGFLHMLNPGANWIAAVCIAVEAGVLLAAAYVTTRRLWMPIGLHFAWNFAQGGIFGGAVSGIAVRGLLKATLNGPELLSGGAFGAEASIFAVVICTSMAIALIILALRKDKIVHPFWTRARAKDINAIEELPMLAGNEEVLPAGPIELGQANVGEIQD
jgi:membrane protease YdiL (CAAX protease family)